MKSNRLILWQLAVSLLLALSCSLKVSGQTYKPGDLYVFDDGSMGIVFYVNPDDPGSGTVAALNDLGSPYALWTGDMPTELLNVPYANGSANLSLITSWENHGKLFTQVLAGSGLSPVADALGASGWYIPDVMQLYKLYAGAVTLQDAFTASGGDILSIWSRSHWSATRVSRYTNQTFFMDPGLRLSFGNGSESRYVRPVRDFPDTAAVRVFWADNPPQKDTVVRPETTTAYPALAVYRSDSLLLNAVVTVFQPVADTLYDSTVVSSSAYTSPVSSRFHHLDVSLSGDYEYADTLQTTHGCDSVTILKLKVNEVPNPDDTHYYDTICPFAEDYYFAPFDTVFGVGTLSGVYTHHGTKESDGTTVDTTAVYHLTILPDYKVFDTLSGCLYESGESAVYVANEHLVVTADGTTVEVAVSSAEITVEEVVPGQDYKLKMQTVNGCDSVLYLHVGVNRVVRDSVFYEMVVTEVHDGQVTAACHTFTGIDGPGVYRASDTLVAENGCDSIVFVELTVSPCVPDFTFTCPPDVYDTLAFGDCTKEISLARIGEPTVVSSAGWPVMVSHDLPMDMLFMEGDHLVTWTVIDAVCGSSVTCEQHVVVVFPPCPDAVDCEGNVYHGVRIGCDCWTQRNLESTKYSDCTDIPEVYEYESWQHPDVAANVAVYGRLYSFGAAVRDKSDNGYGHIQGICPAGWYLPTPEKYEELDTYGAAALKSPLYWIDGGGNNSTGFTALPAGFYNGEKDRYEGMLTEAYFWSVQNTGSDAVKSSYIIRYLCDSVLENVAREGVGYSVRCIKER